MRYRKSRWRRNRPVVRKLHHQSVETVPYQDFGTRFPLHRVACYPCRYGGCWLDWGIRWVPTLTSRDTEFIRDLVDDKTIAEMREVGAEIRVDVNGYPYIGASPTVVARTKAGRKVISDRLFVAGISRGSWRDLLQRQRALGGRPPPPPEPEEDRA